MKRLLLFIAFISTAGFASAQTAKSTAAPQHLSSAEEQRMAFASRTTQLDVNLQRNVPAAATEIMNSLLADMQKHIGQASREMNGTADAVSKAEIGKRIAAQSDIYSTVKSLSVNMAANRETINLKLREFVKVM